MAFQSSPRARGTPSVSLDSPQNRQESHRIYLQVFAPHSASHPAASASNPAACHHSHDVHPPEYPMTAAGAPYQFPSSESSASTFTSFAFSSISAATPASSITDTSTTANAGNIDHGATSKPKQTQKPRYIGYPSTSTTSAAVRLTDRAKAKDVTALLRGKFGLPPINIHVGSTDRNVSSIQQTMYRGFPPSSSNSEDENEVDVLVLVGTLERPPKGYIRFEHENILEEQSRLENFRRYKNSREAAKEISVSASADTIRASGGDKCLSLAPSVNNINSFSSTEDLANIASGSSSTIGLDLSSSRGGTAFRNTPWGNVAGMNDSTRNTMQPPIAELPVPLEIQGSVADSSSASNAESEGKIMLPFTKCKPGTTYMDYEYDSEPIHIVRTVHPNEHPLQVRDEMLESLVQLRREAEDEMGLRLHLNIDDEEKNESLLGQQLGKPIFRWFFQPCSAFGGSSASRNPSKVQHIPLYIDLEGYCTGDDESDSDHSDSDNSVDRKENKTNEHLSPVMKRLAVERRHIAMLRDLVDPVFVLSGYLLKKSRKDPNIWRRVYCVLGEDRLWTIRRMKSLRTRSGRGIDCLGNEDVLSSLRLGRHSYILLHRSLLLESGDGADSPLGRRLPNTFRIIPFNGSDHTFRAFNMQSFKVWASAIAEKITLNHCDRLMNLANVIAEDEVVTRYKRIDDVAISPLLGEMTVIDYTKLPSLAAEVTRFGVAVAEYRELCRRATNTMEPRQNYGVAAAHISVAWEDARIVASKSAQLLHSFNGIHQEIANSIEVEGGPYLIDNLLVEQKALQTRLGRRWDSIRDSPHQMSKETVNGENDLALPPMDMFDSLLDMFQILVAKG